MKLGEVLVHMGTSTAPSLNSLIFANSLTDDPALSSKYGWYEIRTKMYVSICSKVASKW